MGILELIFIIISTVSLTVGLIAALLRIWLKGQLQELTVALQVLNTTVTHFQETQKDIGNRVERLDRFTHENRERIIKTEGKVDAAHLRVDNMEHRIDVGD